MKRILLFLLLAWSFHASADDRPIVVIFDIQVKSLSLKADVVSGLTDYLVARVAASGLYQVVPRDQIRERLTERKKDSYKTCYDQSCQIEIGKELAANKALSAQVLKVGKKCVVTMTLYDLGRAATDIGETTEGGCGEDDIMKLIRAAVDRITGTMSAEPISDVATPAEKLAPAPVVPAFAAELRWPPACPPNNPARCLELSREMENQGKYNQAILFAGMAYSRAVNQKDWNTQTEADIQLLNLSKRYISNQADMERLLDGACTRGDSSACLTLADFLDYTKQYEKAFSLFSRACSLGSSTACKDVGLLYKKGKGVTQNDAKSFEFFRKACDSGNLYGCTLVAQSYLEGAGTQKDPSKAAEIARKSCDARVMYACNLLGNMYLTGNGVPQEKEKAADLYRLACDGGEMWGCFNLAEMYYSGTIGTTDKARASELYRKACDGGNFSGCNSLGNMYFSGEVVGQDRRKASELYQKACDGGEMWGCFSLGNMYYSGTIGTTDKARASELYRKACDGGIKEACK